VGKTRLSVQPVRENEWKFILTLEDKKQEDWFEARYIGSP
jgi:predicted RNA-binding protein with PUA-like domain